MGCACLAQLRRVVVFLVARFCCAAPPFLESKNPLFGVQKGGFWCVKVWFLKCKKWVFVFRMRNHHEINELRASYDNVVDGLR